MLTQQCALHLEQQTARDLLVVEAVACLCLTSLPVIVVQVDPIKLECKSSNITFSRMVVASTVNKHFHRSDHSIHLFGCNQETAWTALKHLVTACHDLDRVLELERDQLFGLNAVDQLVTKCAGRRVKAALPIRGLVELILGQAKGTFRHEA